MNDIPCFEFPVTIYNILEQFTPTLSRARVRIFYKGANRNGSFISDEFAEKLISSLPYAPVKGIYDVGEQDYSDHGPSNEYGRIYGVVPADNNFAWETNVDDDGVTRTYAACDVILYTAMYKEAGEIVGKPQSMELFPPSIKGEWIVYNGSRYFKFTDGCFFGLQVLGTDVEPCFEGAGFFTRQDAVAQITELIEKLNEYVLKYSYGGKSKMTLNFKVSDREKFDAIWTLLNPNYNEENGWVIDYSIVDIYDEYAIVYNYENHSYAQVTYTKSDEDNTVALGEFTTIYAMFVTESEKNALEALRTLNGDSFELVNEKFSAAIEAELTANNSVEEAKAKIEEYSTKISELENNLTTLNTEKETISVEFNNASEKISVLEEEVNSLKDYKAAVEKEKKLAIINTYSSVLSDEVIEDFTNRIDEYVDEISLDKDMAYALKKSNFSIFNQAPEYIPTPAAGNEDGGLRELLSQYKK